MGRSGWLDEPVAADGHGPGEMAEDQRQVADDVAAVQAERPQTEPVERVEMDQAVLERRSVEGRDQHAAASHGQRAGPEQIAEERVLPGPGQLAVEQLGAETAVVQLQVPGVVAVPDAWAQEHDVARPELRGAAQGPLDP